MKEYLILPQSESGSQNAAAVGKIDCFPWDAAGYRPDSRFSMTWAKDRFYVRFSSLERELRIQERGVQPNVYRDSAVELFLMPSPLADGRYVNLECNAAGAMYIGVGAGRNDNRFLSEEDPYQFRVRTAIQPVSQGYAWELSMEVPFGFLRKYTAFHSAEEGTLMRGNFYKIADGTSVPYYACWNPIQWPEPDFHRPEFFGSLLCR